MGQNHITKLAEAHVKDLLNSKLDENYRFHDLGHTLAVRDAALKIAGASNLTEEDREVVELAALFHDVGYTKTYMGHESSSLELAADFLTLQNYPEEKRKEVLDCIAITNLEREPTTFKEKVIRDADLSNLGSTEFFQLLQELRYEWIVFKQEEYTDEEWHKLNHQFVKKHNFLTAAAQEIFGAQKKLNQKQLKDMVKKDKKAKAEPEAKVLSISNSKSAQMMFKTASRNHIDLSNLADNKANIMLSVNAAIVTVAIPLGSTYVSDNQFLFYPLLTLLVTCLASMIYATLATRPIKMNGYTDLDRIKEGRSNLFFFGNFYKMDISEYQTGLQHVLASEDNLENSITRDLYFLGRSLGAKYNQLRICYNVFMLGIILSVFVFAFSYYLHVAAG